MSRKKQVYTWYYNGIVSLFIEGERYEQEKTSL